jgi:TonB family protein
MLSGFGRVMIISLLTQGLAFCAMAQKTTDTMTLETIPPDTLPMSWEYTRPVPEHEFSPQFAYPESAKAAFHGPAGSAAPLGFVTYRVYVDKTGRIRQHRLICESPSGYGFSDEAEKVLPRWRFAPSQLRGQPVGAWTTITLETGYVVPHTIE